MIDLSIIIVSWNVWDLLRANLSAIEKSSRIVPEAEGVQVNDSSRHFGPLDCPATLEVIVVDNDSADATSSLVPSLFPWVRFVQSGENLGFTRGNNLGYSHAKGRFVYFLNPDTEVIRDSLWILYSAIAPDETIGVVGPYLQYGDGIWQNNRRRFPTRWTGFWESTWLGALWPENPWQAQMHMEDWPHESRHDVDWLVGAAICVRREALDAICTEATPAPFDEGYFMYSEELDLCKRIKDAGWRVVYIPTATVVHYEGRSSEQVLAARHIHFNTSKVRYYRKFFGKHWAELLRRYLLLEFRWQRAVERLKYALRHKRELRRSRIEIYEEVLATRLLR